MAEYHTAEELLEKNSVWNLILRLGISAMFGQFFNMLYSMVDRIFVGRIPETGGIALASIPGVLNAGDIDKTDGCKKAAALADVI